MERLLSFLRMTQKFISYIPIIGSAFSFSFGVWRSALFELVFLWVLSSLPIIFSIVSKYVSGMSFVDSLAGAFNINVIFLYTAAFLSPILYSLAKRVIYPRTEKIFHGAGWIFLASVIILVFSAFVYENNIYSAQNINISADSIRNFSLVIYFISIYFWFLSIADNCNGSNYISSVNNDTEHFVNATKRVGAKK